MIPFDRKRKNELALVVDRLKVNTGIKHRLFETIQNAAQIGGDKIIAAKEKEDIFFNLAFAVEKTGKSFAEITPQTFAFNKAEGMCPDCLGLGTQYGANLSKFREIMELSVMGLLRYLWGEHIQNDLMRYVEAFIEQEGIDSYAPLHILPHPQLHRLMNGTAQDRWYTLDNKLKFRWTGINNVLAKIGRNGKDIYREQIVPLLDELVCPSCNGSRLNPLGRNVTIKDKSISDVCQMPIIDSLPWMEKLPITKENKLLDEVKQHLINRMRFLTEVGLHYISLDRRAPTLSGGETQRIRLARQLGSGLTGVLYVLDEPTIGLHPRDTSRLNDALQKLKSLGNTLLMVEHDPLTIETADYILDFGPASGDHGGHITAQGTYKQILRNPHSLTGAYFSGKKSIPIQAQRRTSKEKLKVKNGKIHNLKNISVEIPVGCITCLTGVSGSGKSTLMHAILKPALEKGIGTTDQVKSLGGIVSGIDHFERVISIDQNPIGHTVRSDVCTYVDVLGPIREFYASIPLAKARGLQPKHFSYNHRRGMCTNCWGMGYRKVEMHFLPPVRVVCDQCHGKRLNPVSLEITYQGKNVGQLLEMTVEEVRHMFANFPRIVRILDTLIAVGLGYLKLGQEMVSLSGGEAQRIKLSRELAKRSTGKTIYLLDEPTTGLHSDDILKLLAVLQKLVDKGNTMVIIEHNMEVIKNADYIIDLGPEAGDEGGKVIVMGTPEKVADQSSSLTGKYLKPFLSN